MGEPQFLKAQVVIPVSDIYDTTSWYERVLGFETRYIHGSGRPDDTEDFANYAIMGRDTIEVHFIMDEGGPVWTRSGTGYLYSGCATWRRPTPG
jgi:catechol 2,3-dioxygenase-like lactoylglutathione lyase family enzyme